MDELTCELAGPAAGLREPEEVFAERRAILLGDDVPCDSVQHRPDAEAVDERMDRLVGVMRELARRVRVNPPDENADWLCSVTDDRDRFELLFVQAAAINPSCVGKALEWARAIEEEFVDEIAVERAVRGEPVRLTRLEQVAAMVDMGRRGVATGVIADRIGQSRRFVERFRAGDMARELRVLTLVRGER